MKNNILLVDDDQDLLAVLELKLSGDGFKVQTALDGESALKKIKKKSPDLVILDVNLPGMNGMEICKTLRSEEQTKNIPILMLTARDEEIDRVLGLEFGADDYVTKPFNTRELVLRIKSILKRAQGMPETKETFEYGCLRVDMKNHEVKVKNKVIALTLTEFKLLSYLIENPGKVQTRDFLLDHIWDYGEDVFSRTVDTHVQRLRSKLNEAGNYIQTVRGVGYRFKDN